VQFPGKIGLSALYSAALQLYLGNYVYLQLQPQLLLQPLLKLQLQLQLQLVVSNNSNNSKGGLLGKNIRFLAFFKDNFEIDFFGFFVKIKIGPVLLV
jgi:hypothetical protein